jgi:hypothetical protein
VGVRDFESKRRWVSGRDDRARKTRTQQKPTPLQTKGAAPRDRPEGQAKKEGERLKFGCGLVAEGV